MVALFGDPSSEAFLGRIAALGLKEFVGSCLKDGPLGSAFGGGELGLPLFEFHGRFEKCPRFSQP